MIHKDESPESSIVLRIAAAGRSMAAQGRTVETFDTGPNILVTEQSDNERVEVAVERDSLMDAAKAETESSAIITNLIFILEFESTERLCRPMQQ